MGCGVSGECFLLLLDSTQSEHITKCKTIFFYQDSTNDKILRHEGV